MPEKPHNSPTGFITVATASALLGKSREWIYSLTEGDEPRLKAEEKIIPGRGFRPVKLITLESFLEYVRHAPQYNGTRTGIMNKARGEATKVKPIEFSAEEKTKIKERYEGGEGCELIARDYRSSAATIAGLLRSMGVTIKKPGDRYQEDRRKYAASLPEATRERIKSDYEAGHGPSKIADNLGWGRGQHGKVRRALQGMGYTLRDRAAAQQANKKDKVAA
jgi:hypothetical protein